MQFTTRLASSPASLNFPLPTTQSSSWQRIRTQNITCGSLWQTQIELPEIPTEHIIVPSYACSSSSYQYQWSLGQSASNTACVLQPITALDASAHVSFRAANETAEQLTAKIDCWHTTAPTPPMQACLTVYLAQTNEPPENDLVALSVRPIDMDMGQLPTQSIINQRPPALSQMQARPEIAQRICSPTATAMAIAAKDAESQWLHAIEHCLDPHTKAYGKWPLAVYWASQQGRIGSIEAISSWSSVVDILAEGCPIVCSIKFGKNSLPNAPLTQSGGHLVVLYGIQIELNQGYALVMDPASPTVREVPRRYPLTAFSKAWLAHRGGAYVFAPVNDAQNI
ncbi:MAG TPA: hypothetical protein DE147_08015 [Gammaproteobacteria bacterium]|nr:hypothetical protein [Gammaproteobacteria bacterium]